MKRFTIYLLFLIALPLVFLAASCEKSKKQQTIDNLLLIQRQLANLDSIHRAMITMKNITIQRQEYSLQDLSQEIEKRDREIAKLKERLKQCK